jgi:hypothetical protein
VAQLASPEPALKVGGPDATDDDVHGVAANVARPGHGAVRRSSTRRSHSDSWRRPGFADGPFGTGFLSSVASVMLGRRSHHRHDQRRARCSQMRSPTLPPEPANTGSAILVDDIDRFFQPFQRFGPIRSSRQDAEPDAERSSSLPVQLMAKILPLCPCGRPGRSARPSVPRLTIRTASMRRALPPSALKRCGRPCSANIVRPSSSSMPRPANTAARKTWGQASRRARGTIQYSW